MKKIIIILVTIFGLISCVSSNNNNDGNSNSHISDTVIIPIENGVGNDKMKIDVIKFNYNNHQYIYFMPYGCLDSSSVVHDPDCPCYKYIK